MSHIFNRIVNLKPLRSAIRGMLGQNIQEMNTINLETSSDEDNVDMTEVLNKAKKKRKSKYYVTELCDWSIFDWELELQLAPEFEDVREKIQELQDKLMYSPGADEMEEATIEVEEKSIEILKKKIMNKAAYNFKALSKDELDLARDKNKIPTLDILAEEIGLDSNKSALVLNLEGVLNATTAKKINILLDKIIDVAHPYLILDFTGIEWLDKSSLKYMSKLNEKMSGYHGSMAVVIVDPSFRSTLKSRDGLGEVLFLDRAGAVEHFIG